MEKRQKSSGGGFLNEGVHDVIIKDVEEKKSEKTGGVFYKITYENGSKKATQILFPPRQGEKYDPSTRNNRLNEELFQTVFGLNMDPENGEYVDNIQRGYGLIASANLKGAHAKIVLGYNGLHAKYIRGDRPSYMLCKKNGEPMMGYEDKKFDTRDAVAAELETLNSTRPPDKQFKLHRFCEVQSFLPPKESNSALLAKYLKNDEDAGEVDESSDF